MIADREHSVLEHLRTLRATQADPGERLIQIELQMYSINQRLSALTKAVYGEKTPSPIPASPFRTFASDSKTVRGEPVEPRIFTDECPSTVELAEASGRTDGAKVLPL
jgi:hypothetical protein